MKPERAVVLAAGLGTRMKWLTRARPKPLLPLAAEPMITGVVRRLVAAGVRWIAVNLHHKAEALAHVLGDGRRYGCTLRLSLEAELLDSGAGAVRAARLLPSGEDPILIHNADVASDLDFARLVAAVPKGGAALALVPRPAWRKRGDFGLDDHGYVLANVSDPAFVFAGISAWDPSALFAFGDARPWPLAEAIRALACTKKVQGLVHRGFWQDLGTPRRWWQARWR